MNLFQPTHKSAQHKIRVFPQGLAVSGDELTSFVLFKDKEGLISFPIWCPVFPVSLVASESDFNIKSPYDFTHIFLEKLSYKISECVFDGIETDEQKASIYLEKKVLDDNKAIDVKASLKTNLTSSKQLSFLDSWINPEGEPFKSGPKITLKAYEALALCSSKKEIMFSATESFIHKTRDVAVFEKKNPSELLKKNSFLKSRQKYLM